jgi:hypothetical protein
LQRDNQNEKCAIIQIVAVHRRRVASISHALPISTGSAAVARPASDRGAQHQNAHTTACAIRPE